MQGEGQIQVNCIKSDKDEKTGIITVEFEGGIQGIGDVIHAFMRREASGMLELIDIEAKYDPNVKDLREIEHNKITILYRIREDWKGSQE